jgi:iron(III) transport system ATP-binding protein
MIRIENLRKSFGTFEAVRGVSLDVPKGSFLVLVGPSGCGKSTMLRMLAGLETPSAGTIAYGGRVVSDGARNWTIEPAKRDNGLVFQSYALWPTKPERRQRIAEVLKLLGIAELAGRYPNEISGGQQQRVAIARMIAPKPGILLFDEPLSNLDAKLRVEMRTELLRIPRATGATSVYVTHDQVEAMTMASHVAVMNEGLIEQFGTPEELVAKPVSTFVATFVGTPPANLVPILPSSDGPTLAGRIADRTLAGSAAAHAMFRAEDIAVTAEPTARSLALDFAEASPIAGRLMVTGTSGDLRLTAIVDEAPCFTIGDIVHFSLPARPSALFTASGARLN